jgi:hypothetical protein
MHSTFPAHLILLDLITLIILAKRVIYEDPHYAVFPRFPLTHLHPLSSRHSPQPILNTNCFTKVRGRYTELKGRVGFKLLQTKVRASVCASCIRNVTGALPMIVRASVWECELK